MALASAACAFLFVGEHTAAHRTWWIAGFITGFPLLAVAGWLVGQVIYRHRMPRLATKACAWAGWRPDGRRPVPEPLTPP